METTIKNLIEYDKEGQKIVREAELQRSEVLSHMADYKHELVESYTARLNARVKLFAEQAESEAGDKLGAAQAVCKARLERMQSVYEEGRGAWVSEMFTRCIGG